MALQLPFDAFWTFATERAQQRNTLSYHKCCDVWTTRTSKTLKASHSSSAIWSAVLLTLDRSASDQKQALHAKMIEEGMQIPVLINNVCIHNLTASVASQRGRKFKIRTFQSELAQPCLDNQDFEHPDQTAQNMETPSSIFCLT